MRACDAPPSTADALRLTLEVWHPDCWVLQTTRQAAVGLLSYGVFTRTDGCATTLFTLYGDTTSALDDGVSAIRSASAVFDVASMTRDHRGRGQTHGRLQAGNATRELLVDHDGTTQISEAFTDRGFVPAEAVDARDDTEHWTLLTQHDRETVERLLDEVRAGWDATIAVTSITRGIRASERPPLPLDRLSSRQREVFRYARANGYYEHPRETDVSAIATALGLSSSTVHEHLRKAEAALLGTRFD
ncbi:bacterio-opsin activator [Salinigranum rubrum]|uniref:Bacterio-opsin activator n=1 Tax=Salinigranum rubrum TaxID=755307 RepID=A0A2I8VJR7_9EURY|nr:helix-turn-helix domain-containing protein [Salinigranum rubrum]AUV82170.1 bacterio-opsin activator [Salinigranum rubrum]